MRITSTVCLKLSVFCARQSDYNYGQPGEADVGFISFFHKLPPSETSASCFDGRTSTAAPLATILAAT